MPKTYDPILVALSVLIAVWASYDALILAGRVSVAGARARPIWLIAGSLAMGMGIWCMHFVGMLALHLSVPLGYEVRLVVLSVVVAIVAAAIAFALVCREAMSLRTYWLGGVFMGLAIGGMHYTAMAGMRPLIDVHYNLPLAVLSLLLAISAPFVALRFAFSIRKAPDSTDPKPKLAPALLMGGGIAGMHYTAMAAARFAAMPPAHGGPSHLVMAATPELATVVVLGTAGMLGMAQLGVIISRREERVRQSEERLRALTVRIEAAREEERTRIAREIHDEVGQTLTVLQLDVNWLGRHSPSDTSLTSKIRSMSELLHGTLGALQRLASELRPPALDRLGLRAAILELARDFESRTGVRSRVNVAAEDGELDGNLAIAVYRIAQEALTNVSRHAKASRVEITFRLTPSELELRVQDNGCGISDLELTGPASLGILGMRERAQSWGGDLFIESALGGGTSVRVSIPLGGAAPGRRTA